MSLLFKMQKVLLIVSLTLILTVMPNKKSTDKNDLCILKVSWKHFIPKFCSNLLVTFAIFLKNSFFNSFYCLFCYKQIFTAQWLKTRTTMNVKISVFVFCVKEMIYLLLYNLHDCTFKVRILHIPKLSRNAKGYLISQNLRVMQRD